MATRQRNPLFGGILALLMIGFGSYRFYIHYTGIQELQSWQLIITGAVLLYGLYVAYSVLTQKKDDDHE